MGPYNSDPFIEYELAAYKFVTSRMHQEYLSEES
jgi:hypothetical protein